MDRRNFLKTTTSAYVGIAVGAPVVLGGCEPSDSRPSEPFSEFAVQFSGEMSNLVSQLVPEHVATVAQASWHSLKVNELHAITESIKTALDARSIASMVDSELDNMDSWRISETNDLGRWLATFVGASLGSVAGQNVDGYRGAALGTRLGATLANRVLIDIGVPLPKRTSSLPSVLQNGGDLTADAGLSRFAFSESWLSLTRASQIPRLGEETLPYGSVVVPPHPDDTRRMTVRRLYSAPFGQKMIWDSERHASCRSTTWTAVFILVETDAGLHMRAHPVDSLDAEISFPGAGRMAMPFSTFGLLNPSGNERSVFGAGEIHVRSNRLSSVSGYSAAAYLDGDPQTLAEISVDRAARALKGLGYDTSELTRSPLPSAPHVGCDQ